MLERLSHMGMGVYVLWGIGLLGLFLKMVANSYLKSLLRESENMATTRKKSLRYMRQTYENGKNLGIRTGSSGAFAEKQVRKICLLGKPFAFWRRIGELLTCVLVSAMAAAFLYYDPGWRGSPEMVTFLANGMLVGVCLLSLENIFLINNKVERLKANISDYLENLTPMRVTEERGGKDTGELRTHRLRGTESGGDFNQRETLESAATLAHHARDENKGDSGGDLNRFLREFFGPCEAKSEIKQS